MQKITFLKSYLGLHSSVPDRGRRNEDGKAVIWIHLPHSGKIVNNETADIQRRSLSPLQGMCPDEELGLDAIVSRGMAASSPLDRFDQPRLDSTIAWDELLKKKIDLCLPVPLRLPQLAG